MSSLPPVDDIDVTAALSRTVHDHWGLFLAEGIILSLLGVAAMTLPVFAGLATSVLLGWLFLIAGIIGLVATLRGRALPGFGWSLLSALVAILVGGVLVLNPFDGMVTLTFILIAFFIADGLSIISLAIAHRRQLSGRWEWMLANGILDLILAGLIISGWPGTLVWVLGFLVGIDMLFGGASLIGMALAARKPR